MTKKQSLLTGILVLLLAGLACQLTPSPAVPTNPPTPSAAAPATATPPAATPTVFEDLFLLSTNVISEESADPNYILKVKEPQIEGSQDERTAHFNREVDYQVHELIDGFKKDLQSLPTPPPGVEWGRNSLDVDYAITNGDKGLISALFTVSIYTAGAAHPFPSSMVLTYDLRQDRTLALTDLFKPDANYLDVIAHYCKEDLQKQGMLEFPEGTTAELNNFKSWNVQPDGLLITFDPAQVMPYVAGYQKVLIPFDALKEIILADGPLAPLL